MNKLLYKVIRKFLIKTTQSNNARKVYLGPLKGKKWIYSSGYSQYFMGDYEKEVVDIFYEYAEKSKVIYDIGANIGYYTLIASKAANDNSKVYAFEPFPENVIALKKNIEVNNNSNIMVLEFAISNKIGRASFSNSDNNVANTLCEDSPTFKNNKSIEVRTITIDDLILNNTIEVPDLIKMDVEGTELEALIGAEETLKKYHPVIFLSTHNCHVPGIHKKCIDYLENLGYEIEYLNFRENKTKNDDPWYEVLARYKPN
ncbi:MAG: FkbM family methyltransferase [Bacteroidota bacterium]|nr:FkbM family methyltransferase [Bacteroidota bacterium]MDP3144345.1 FkbM family methyltransferase [Bacteroidota bacterium]